jgi:hypothetical protein
MTGTETPSIQCLPAPTASSPPIDVAAINAPNDVSHRSTVLVISRTHRAISSIALVNFSGAFSRSLACANPLSKNARNLALDAASTTANVPSPRRTFFPSSTHSEYHLGTVAKTPSLNR